ncbi:hypothetical protein HHK36_030958 [Tetracentron sinense]|uniref:O-acyltransferase WSD1 C-terminal domain-containing protein n=1 Tax=Tetracentron sinense TaxID=13715 RepID=A0A835D168_TETSI|nr:hypothetical protein HHK36_030958 [Tetracentron sinense]
MLVRDNKGREYWRRTKVEIERHFLVRDIGTSNGDEEEVVNGYSADLAVSMPLNTDKPLWEFHAPVACPKVLRIEIPQRLGGWNLLDISRSGMLHHPDQPATISSSSKISNTSSINICRKVWRLMEVAWFTLVFVLGFVQRSLWVKDAKTAHMQTINDVLLGIISSGLSRYLDLRTALNPQEGLQITGVAMVNLRKQPGLQDLTNMMRNKSGSRWGNQIGFFLLPLYYHKDVDPVGYVKRAKAMIDQKKQSLEAHISYWVGHLVMSSLGQRSQACLITGLLVIQASRFRIWLGPQEEIMLAGNPITYLRANGSSVPYPIIMHNAHELCRKSRYANPCGKEIIPDPQFLAKCFQDALLEMKDAVTALATTY